MLDLALSNQLIADLPVQVFLVDFRRYDEICFLLCALAKKAAMCGAHPPR